MIIDDRFCNQHPNFQQNNELVPSYTTLDVVKSLLDDDVISTQEDFNSIILLREANFHLIPFTELELHHWLNKAQFKEGRLVETAELKVIRKYLTKLKMSSSVVLPRDAEWLAFTLRFIQPVMKL